MLSSSSDEDQDNSDLIDAANKSHSNTSDVELAVKYTWNDIKSRPRNFTIGFCSTFIVVFFVGLILIGISKTPVIFLRFAETTTGEMDSLLLAGGGTPFLNFTQVEPKIAKSAYVTGSTPRWLLRGQLYPGDTNDLEIEQQQQQQQQDTTTATAANSSSTNTTTTTSSPLPKVIFAGTSILIGNTFRETALGIGRGWPYRPIGYAEAQVLDTILHFLKVRPNVGDRTTLNVDIAGILRQQGVDPSSLTGGILGTAGGGGGGGVPTVPVVPATNITPAALDPNANVTLPGVNGSAPTIVTVQQLFAGLAGLAGANLTLNQSAALVNAANTFLQTNVNGTPTININAVLAALTLPTAADVSAQLLSPTFGLTVADGFDEAYGKFPSTLGNMIVMDQRYLLKMFLDQLCYDTLRQPLSAGGLNPAGAGAAFTVPGLPSAKELEKSVNIDHFALIVVAMMRNRYETYYSEALERTQKIIRFSNDLFRALGLGFSGDAQYPIAIALVAFDFFSLFLDSLFSSVVAVIVVMGFLLVYTLLLTNTEERSFEVAMLRAQGMNKVQLIMLLASQSTAFIVPAISIAVAVLFSVNAILEVVLATVTLAPADTSRVTVASIVFPVCVGVCIPLIANYRPVLSIMKESLRDALSMYRHAASETTVTVMKLAELGLAPWQTLVGWMLVIGGFIVYYLVPLSFLFQELTMFFVLMNLILLGLLLGLCLISFTVQERVERWMVWLLLWGKDKCLSMLVQKNLAAHADRNGKAFLMFTVTSAVLIFGGSLFTLLAISISDTVRVINGADINVQSLTETAPLNRSSIDAFLRQERDDPKKNTVSSWSYATFSLNDFPQVTSSPIARLSTVIGFPSARLQVQGIDENFLETVFPEFVLVSSTDPNVKYQTVKSGAGAGDDEDDQKDFVKSMYTTPPQAVYTPVGEIFTGFPPNQTRPNIFVKYSAVIPIVVASSAESVLGITASAASTITFDYKIGGEGAGSEQAIWRTVFLASARTLVDKLSGFPTMTNLQIAFRSSIVLTSFDGFRTLLRANQFDFGDDKIRADPRLAYGPGAITEPTFGRLWIRLRPGLSTVERADFANRLRLVLNPYFHLAIDTATIVDSVQTASDLIMYFFYFVSVIAIVLDTFMLWLTFISNIQLNSWSVGVLRSLGFTESQVTRAFVYEALTLVLGSFICGTIIGLTVAVTVILQMTLLLTLPFQMNFPTGLFFFLLALSIVSAFAASIIPSRAICRRPISLVLKKG